MTRSRSDALIGTLYLLATIIAWGVYFPLAKLILLKLTPLVFVILRFGIGALVLGAMSVRLRKSFRIRRQHRLHVLAAAMVGIVFHQLIQLNGLVYTSATHVGWILTLIPPVTGVLGWIFLRERISLRQWVGLIIAMTGVVFFVTDGAPGELSLGGNRGDLLVLASVLTWAVYTVITKSHIRHYDALPLTAMYMGVASVVFLLFGAWDIPAQIRNLTLREWMIVIAVGVVPSGLAYYWWNAALQKLSAVNTSMFLFLEAIVASIASFLILGELFSGRMVVFSLVVVAGVYVAESAKSRMRGAIR